MWYDYESVARVKRALFSSKANSREVGLVQARNGPKMPCIRLHVLRMDAMAECRWGALGGVCFFCWLCQIFHAPVLVLHDLACVPV